MDNLHKITCRCGSFEATVESDPKDALRIKCYCKDCRAFPAFCECSDDYVGENGSADLLTADPAKISFDKGANALKIVRLSTNGVYRWYAGCCNTPLGNVPANHKIPHFGYYRENIRNIDGNKLTEEQLPPVKCAAFKKEATSTPPKKPGTNLPQVILYMAKCFLRSLRREKETSFFSQKGEPKAPITQLSNDELNTLFTPSKPNSL